MKLKFAPALLAADFLRLGDELERARSAGADLLHFDVMDGVYVPNISFGFPVLKAVSAASDLPLDVHMMTALPEKYLEALAQCGAQGVTLHVDLMPEEELIRAFEKIRAFGMKPAAALKPRDPADALLPFAPLVDMALVMTVEPGFGGQRFMTDMLPKIRAVRDILDRQNPSCDLEVDGGIGPSTIDAAARAGANVFVVGTAAFRAPDMAKALSVMRESAGPFVSE